MPTEAPPRKSIFVTPDGKSLFTTFALVTSLFFIWGFCNGLIEMTDKHFQSTLSLTKAQSSMVQFANFVGYLCMAIDGGSLSLPAPCPWTLDVATGEVAILP